MRRIPFVPALLVAVVMLAAAVPAAAVQSDLTIFLDFDNNAATGCNDPVSGFQGYDQKVVTTVDTTTGPNDAMVTQIEGLDCSNTQVFFDGTDHPVGIGNGDLGLNVIETYWPIVSLSPPPTPCHGASHAECLRLGVFASNANGGEDALFTTNGAADGPPILFIVGGTSDIPTLSEWGLLALIVLLAGAAAFKLRRRPLRALLLALMVLAAGGVAYAIVFDLDGNTLHEWNLAFRVAHDPTATDDGDDIASLYARTDIPTARVNFRIDASLVFNTAPVVTTTAGATTFTEDGPAVVVDGGVTVTDADSPNLASATVTITNPQNGALEVLAAGPCAGLTVTPGVNSLGITGSAPPATYQTCFQSVTYNNTSNTPGTTPRVVAFVANDGITNSAPGNKTVNVTPNDDAPVVTTTAGDTAFIEDGGPVVVDAGVAVSDVDSANLASATVSITNVQDVGFEVLAATACGALTVGGSGTPTLTITGSQSLATYQTCLQSVTYDDTSNNPSTTNRTVSFVVNDGTSASAPANKTVTVAPDPDAPVVLTTGGSTSFTEDGGAVVVDAGVTVTDPDNANLASATVTITNVLDVGFEGLAATACGAMTVGGSGTPTLTISGSQPLAAYQTCLQSVTYNNTDQDPDATARVISFVANDGANSSAPANKTVTVTPVNDAPVVTTTAGSTAFTEGGGAVVVDSGVTVSDVDNANLASATVTITNVLDGAAEQLNATSCAGLTVGGGGTSTLNISGSQPLATYQTCLQSVTYDNTDQDPDTTSRVISFVANDGTASSAAANKTVTVGVVDNAPVVTTTAGSTAFTEDGGAVVVDAGVTVTDADSPNLASATVSITNVQDVGFEALAATACGALTVGGSGTATLTISGSQPLATYQTCLQSVTYNDTDQDPSNTARVISFVANDGTSSSAAANKTVTVAPVNDAPVVTTTGGSTAFTEDGGPVVVDSGVTVSDVDNANLASATVSITNVQDVGFEALAATACGALTVGGSGTATLTISGSQPLATYQTCLQSVTYNNTDQDPSTTSRVISFVVNDGALPSAAANKTVTVAAVNDAPVVTTTGGSTSFTEGGGAVVVDSGVTVTDADSPNLASATVTITNVQDVGFEALAATACGAFTVGGSGTPTLTITGSQPPATYQACLQSVTYNNTDLDPGTTARVISFVANDGALPSNTANKTVTVTAVNSAPVVTTTAGTTAFVEDAGPVVVDSGVTVTDLDSTNLASATVTITNVQDGALETLNATACAGLTVTPGVNSVGISGSQPPATYQTCLQSVTYNNASNTPNTTTRVISFVANDGAASSTPATKNVSVAGANDAPIVVTTAGDTAFTEDGPAVVVDSGVTVVDPDSANLASALVTITNPQDGALETLAGPSCAGLTVVPGLNNLTITGAQPPATYQTCLQSVTYNNTSNNPGTTTRVISFVANDGALSSTPANKNVTVAPVNDAPVVTTTGGTTAFTEDAGPVAVDSGVTVTDADSANLVSAVVTITNPQDGAAEVLAATACGGLTLAPALNTLGISGSQPVATYQTCLQSVTYNNSSNNPTTAPNRNISFQVNDGAANSNTANKAVSVTAANDAPTVTTTAGVTSFTEDGPAVVVDSGVTVADVDNANLASATVSITNVQDVTFESLAATACGALTVGGSGTATLNIGGSATLAVYQTCLQSVTYNNTDQDPTGAPNRSISFVVNDGTSSSAAGLKAVSVTPVNDAPTVTTTGGSTTFTEDAGAVAVDGGVTVADVDNANLASATVTITNPQDGAAETLAGPSCAGLTVTPGLNTLAITGSQPKATYQTCLQSVTYNNSSQDPTAAPSRIVSFVVNDGSLSSTPANKTVVVVPVNDAPSCTVTPVVYATAGNTQLQVFGATLAGVARVLDPLGLLAKAAPIVDPDSPGPFTVVPVSGNTGGGDWNLFADGSFTFVPNAGFTGTASRTFQVTDNDPPAALGTCTVNVNVSDVVWYVRDVVDGDNPAAGDDGRSTNAFEVLGDAQAPSTDDDYIYVFEGNTATTPQVGGFAVKNGQKLWGQGIDLDVPGFPNLVTAANKARVRTTTPSTDVVTVPATAGNRQNVEIRGLDLEATVAATTSNAIDVTSSGGNLVGVTITDNNIRGATAEGIDLNNGSTGAFTATVSNDTITSVGNGIDGRSSATGTMTLNAASDGITTTAGNSIDVRTLAGASALRVAIDNANVTASGSGIVVDGSAAGATTITAFGNNVVNGNTGGTGISVTSATFDGTPTGTFQTVNAGTTAVGASGNGVGASGVVLTNAAGDLSFGDLDVFADAGAALRASGIAAYTGSAGLKLAVGASVATLTATGGPAIDLSTVTGTLPFQTISSTNSPTTGVSLVNFDDGTAPDVTASTFSAGGSISNITSAAGTAFRVDQSNADVDFSGTVSTTTGTGINLTTNTSGTVDFTGALTLSTGANAGFAATGGGTVTATNTTSTIVSTTGTGLRVSGGTTIGALGLFFDSISVNGAANGIFLDGTGTGVLTVDGGGSTAQGGDSSGGVIQNTTGGTPSGVGVYVNNARATLRRMHIHDHPSYGIFGGGTTIFNLEYSTVDSTATATSTNGDTAAADDEEGSVAFEEWAGSGTITSSIIGDGFSNNLRVLNTNGADLNRLTVTGSMFNNNGLAGNNNIHLESRNSGTTLNFTLQTSSTVKGARADWINASNNSLSSMDLIISGNTFSNLGANVHAAAAAGGNRLVLGSVGTLTYDILGNDFEGSKGEAIRVRSTAGGGVAGTATGTIDNNDIGLVATPNSGSSEAMGIFLFTDGGGDQTALVNNNRVRQYNNHGIRVDVGDQAAGAGVSVVNVTITNNTVSNPGNINTDFNGIHLNHGTVAADNFTSCIDIRLNSIMAGGQGATAPNNADFRLRQRQATTVRLPGYAGANNNDAAVVTFITNQQTAPLPDSGAASNTVPTGGGFTGGAACLQP